MCDCSPLPSFPLKFCSQFQFQFQPQKPRFLTTSNKFHPKINVQLQPFSSNPPTKIHHQNPKSNNSPPSDDSLQDDGDDKNQRSTSFDFLELKRELEKEGELFPVEGSRDGGNGGLGTRRGGKRQLVGRSSLLAKQVISIRSARSLGFVSQLWVDTRSWMVVLVEVRPNLLSGDNEKFLLEDVYQVGDVVLVQDESIMENELKITGLDTLVGYNVVTSGRRNVGKVRGYTFNINSGVVESLELDSFGVSIIPSSLVSTYCLFVGDVLEVVSDTVTVQGGAASRVQRITKGIWDARNVDKSVDIDEYYDFGTQRVQTFQNRNNRNSRDRRFPRKMRVVEDDWELPKDYR